MRLSDRITLQIEGLMLERLLSRALAEGAGFHRVVRQSRRRMLVVCDAFAADTLMALSEKYHLDCRIVRQKGFRTALAGMRKRITLPVALLICALCSGLFLSRIWLIDVQLTGARPQQDAAALENALSALGVRPGIARSSIDPDLLSLELGAQTENYSFIGVRLQGVRLLVEAAQEVESPDLFEIDHARDLVAACDGVIVSVDAQSGKACVAPGDTVRKGQVLIRGEERISNEETRGVAALGEVVARTWFTAEADAPLTERVRRYTGRESVSAMLRLLEYRIPLSEGETFDLAESQTELLPIGGLFLPLVIERTTLLEYEETTVQADAETVRNSLEAEVLALAGQKMQAETGGVCQIIDKWVDYSMIDAGRLHARAVLEVQRNIASTRDALYQGGN